MYYAGFDVGGTKCAVCLGQELPTGMDILARRQFATGRDKHPYSILEEFADTFVRMIEEKNIPKQEIAGIGISCGGPLDTKAGVIHRPPNLPLWDNIPIVSYFEEKFGSPVHLQNDANACAIAEWKYGAGQGHQNVLFFTFGTGLGAGLILNGKLYEGACGMAGEAGHIRLAKAGPMGYFKEGSFEGFCSGGGIANLGRIYVKEEQSQGKHPLLLQKAGDDPQNITAKLIGDLADEGDGLCRRIYEKSGEMLGAGLSVMIDILNPDIIVIGSIYARSTHLLEPSMRRILEQEALHTPLCRPGPPHSDAEIGFLQLVTLYFFIDGPQRLRIFCGDDNPSGVAVDAVAQRRGKGVLLLGVPLLFLVEVRLNMVDEGIDLLRFVCMDHHAGTLIHQQEIFVLVDNLQPGLKHGQEHVFLRGLVKKLIVDI